MDLRVLSILLFVIGLILYALVYGFDYVIFMQTGDKKYSFLRYFPYELNQFRLRNKKTYLLVFIELLAVVCLISANLFPAIYFSQKLNVFIPSYSMFVVASISIISFLVLRFVKLTLFKTHLFFVTLFVAFNLFTLMLYYMFFTNQDFQFVTDLGVKIAIIVICLILVVFEVFLMLNKTYKNWAKMVKMDAELVSRPKYCFLPILEWGSFLVYIFSYIPLIVVMFF